MNRRRKPLISVGVLLLAIILFAGGLYLMMDNHNQGGLARGQATSPRTGE